MPQQIAPVVPQRQFGSGGTRETKQRVNLTRLPAFSAVIMLLFAGMSWFWHASSLGMAFAAASLGGSLTFRLTFIKN